MLGLCIVDIELFSVIVDTCCTVFFCTIALCFAICNMTLIYCTQTFLSVILLPNAEVNVAVFYAIEITKRIKCTQHM